MKHYTPFIGQKHVKLSGNGFNNKINEGFSNLKQ